MIINVDLKERGYDIVIQNGILDNLDCYIKKPVFTITNTTVYKLYGKKLKKYTKNFVIIKDGEKYKNIKTYEYILNQLLANKIERNDTVLALGGGVVGDLAGFVASTVLRGVNFIQIPTTLLSQVDSSVGGKTAINSKYGKNLIGTFYQPSIVLIDPTVLNTLSEIEVKSGLGEVIKYAFIEKNANKNLNDGETLLDFLLNCNFEEDVDKIISKCIKIKADVVSEDEKETGLRQILNLGHTFAHPIEKISRYKIPHGISVAIGLKMAFDLSLKLNLIEEEYKKTFQNILKKYNLEHNLNTKFNPDKMYKYMLNDKKVKNSKIGFILPNGKCSVMQKSDIDELLVKETLLSSHFQEKP